MHRFINRFHKHILILTVVLSLISVLLLARLELDLNLFSLLPANDPSVNTFLEVSEEIGIQSVLIAIVKMPRDYDRQKCEGFVDLFAKNIGQSRWIDEVDYKTGEEQLSSFFQLFLEHFPLFFKIRDLEKLTLRLSDAGIQRQVQNNKSLLTTPFGFAANALIYEDPLGLRALMASQITLPTTTLRKGLGNGYYHIQTEGTYFLFVRPKEPPQHIVFSKKLLADMAQIEKLTRSEWSDVFGNLATGIEISYTGGYPIAVNDEAITKRDIKTTLLTSFLGVMLLFGLSFKRARILLYVGTPLLLSILFTLGFAGIAFPSLNLLTCVFSCVLIGLGIDFAIHIVNRFFNQDSASLDLPRRLEVTFQETGMGIIIGGISTAAAFYSIAVSDFRGFKELGILTGTGILICLLVMLVVLPAILVYFAEKPPLKQRIVITGFGLKTLLNTLWKYPKPVVVVTLIAVCLLAAPGTRIHFDDNLKNFRSIADKTLQLQDQVTEWLRGSTAAVILVSEETTEARVMEASASIFSALQGLTGSDLVSGINSVGKYFPSPGQQRKAIEYIRSYPKLFDIKRIQTTFNAALEENGFHASNLYDDYFESLSKAFSRTEILLPSAFLKTDLKRLLKPFVFQKGKYFKTITYIYPATDLWSRSDTKNFKEVIVQHLEKNGIPQNRYYLTGPNLLTGDLKTLIVNNLGAAMWLAGLSIVLVLLIYYRSLKLFLLSILPLIIGLAVLSGIMVILGLDFNFLNLMVLPMIVGIGIDDGVHFTNTFRRSHRDISKAMSETGRAIVLTSLTTLVGFGSITLSHYPGLRSMGYVAVIGISACLFASIIVLPAIFSLMTRHRNSVDPEQNQGIRR